MTRPERTLEGQTLEQSLWIDVGDFCAWLHVERTWVAELVEAGVLEPGGSGPERWTFRAADLGRARKVVRLVNDLGVNLAGAAVILDLLEERSQLERRLGLLERLLDE